MKGTFLKPIVSLTSNQTLSKMKKLILTCTAIMCAACAMADVSGSWWGKLSLGVRGSLRIVLNIETDADGSMTATMQSPDQSERLIPATVDFCDADSIAVTIDAVGASYRARVAAGRMSGTFSQAGREYPLEMLPGDGAYARPQTPQPPFDYAVEEVTFSNPAAGNTLAGTLCIPRGADCNTPVLLLVTGSGLQNRDEELAGHRPFAVIADHLARNGIASLRYDDRGFGESTGNGSSATTSDFASDAAAAVTWLRSLDRFGSVGVLGHSEGGTIAVMLAGNPEYGANPDFIISLAGGLIPGREILVSQNRRMLMLSGCTADIADTYCAALENIWGGNGAPVDISKLPDGLRANLLVIPMHTSKSPWTKAFLELDPAKYISAIECPVMALNGTLDCQIDAGENLSALDRGLPASTPRHIVTYDGLNHLFQPAITGMPDEYSPISTTIAPEVLYDITLWIRSLSAR